jgi:hypothetical protein
MEKVTVFVLSGGRERGAQERKKWELLTSNSFFKRRQQSLVLDPSFFKINTIQCPTVIWLKKKKACLLQNMV